MRRLEIKRSLGPDDLVAVKELVAVAEAADGHLALDEHRWLDMAMGGRAGFAGLVAWEPDHPHPVAYAQVSRGQTWSIDLVIDPHHRYDALDIGPEILGAAMDLIAEEGGGHVHFWANHPTQAHDTMAANVGMTRGRDLNQMRRSLPLPGLDTDLVTRPFRPGQDEAAWLEVNNRAFAHHPEQGHWTPEVLRDRQAEAWFEPAGFLLHEREGRLAGFCWTKVHVDHAPALGEIYVIAVDPDFHGLGLGRQLTLAGLAYLSRAGVEMAMLYVDSANKAAVGLYTALGFDIDHIDRAYTGDVEAK